MLESQFKLYDCEEEQVDSEAVIRFVRGLEETGLEYHNFVLFRNNHLIAKGSWHPYDGKHVHNIHSSSKSFTSTAIGMLYDKGLIKLDQKVTDFFPGRTYFLANHYLEEVTIRHLLTMSLGQDFEGFAGDFNNWTDAVLGQPIVRKPGTKFFYSSMSSHMLSEIFTAVTGVSEIQYLKENLFSHMDFAPCYWFAGPGNTVSGGGGLHISIEDFAKFGLLYLNNGVYNGTRYLSEEWINLATSLQIETATSYPSAKVENSQGYGFQFWRCTHNGYRASGMWAQLCLILPDQNIVLAVQSSGAGSEATLAQVWKHLLPGVKNYPLSRDREKSQKLDTYLGGLQIRPAKGDKTSRIESLIPESYRFTKNPYGFKGMELLFQDEKIQVVFHHEWRDYQVIAGRGIYLPDDKSDLADLTHAERDLHMPAWPEDYVKPEIYSCCVWLDESRLLISQRLLNAAAKIQWMLRFDGSCLQAVHCSENIYGSFHEVVLTAPYEL